MERLVQLSGNEEKDFQVVVEALEESGIFSEECIKREGFRRTILVKEYQKEIVKVEFVRESPSGDLAPIITHRPTQAPFDNPLLTSPPRS